MGTGPFAVPSFEALRQSDHEIVAVITKPEPLVKSRKGPPPAPVRTWATMNGLAVTDPISINESDAVELLNEFAADLMVVCDYGQILKPDALASTKLGGINLHGSLLPAYRGAAPVQRSLLAGDSETGVSVIHMTPRLDGGPILGCCRTAIRDDETSGELEDRLSELGVDLVLQCVDQLTGWDGESQMGTVQDAASATKAPRLNKKEAEIDWQMSCREIDVLVRGMQPWPIAFSQLRVRDNKPPLRLSILQVTIVDVDAGEVSPGQVVGGKALIIRTGDGALRIDRLRPAGKREMSGEEFMRGHQLKQGTAFDPPSN